MQQFSDDEGEVDEPLAPLPDDPEVVEGDEDMDQDEPIVAAGPEIATMDVAESAIPKESQDPPSKPSSPKPQPLSMSLHPTSETPVEDPGDVLDASLKPLDNTMDGVVDLGEKLNEDVTELDISSLGPDGTGFESAHDLSQMEGPDALLGGQLMDQTADPFAEQNE